MRDERTYVVGAIVAFVHGTGSPWDWDDFTSSSLRDAELDRIRMCAAAVELPLDSEGQAILLDLLDQAELVSEADPPGPKAWRVKTGMVAGLLAGALLWWINYLPGASPLHNLHLLLLPVALGVFLVVWRNSRMKVGAYAPRIVAQNKQGRV